MGITMSGFCEIYEPEAYAEETPSRTIRDELTCKKRMCVWRFSPLSSPETHISLRHTDEDSVECEVGVIVDLSVFPMEAQTLVRASLDQHYFEFRIAQIYRIDWKFNLLFFDPGTH